MGGRPVLGTIRLTGFDPSWLRSVLLAAIFLAGALATYTLGAAIRRR